jgi:hypothetical protein
MLPGKIIGKSWDLRFRALPGELTFISQRRAGEADRDPVKDPIFVRAGGADASILGRINPLANKCSP